MNRRLRKFSAVIAAGLVVASSSLLPSSSVEAATATNGLTISPASLNFRLEKIGDQQNIPVTLTNNSATSIDLTAEFMGIDDVRGTFVPTGEIDATLAASLRLDRTELTIPARSAQKLNVQFTDTSALPPGGHYATLVITQQSAGGQLALQSAASLTIFATKLGGANAQISLQDTKLNGWLFGRPSEAVMTFKSTGNVLVVPRAAITVTGGEQQLAKAVVNQASLPILPGDQRVIVTKIDYLSNRWLPSKLRVDIVYRADGIADAKTLSFERWYIPAFYPFTIIVLVAIGVWLMRTASGRQFWRAISSLFRRLRRKLRHALHRRKATESRPNMVIQDVTAVKSRKSKLDQKTGRKISVK